MFPITLPTPSHAPRPPWWAAVAARTLWTVAVVGLAVSMIVIDRLLQRVGDTFFTNFATAPVLACVSAATVGAVVATRRPRHPRGWLLLGLPMALTTSGLVAGIMRQPGIPMGLLAAHNRGYARPPVSPLAGCWRP